MATFLLCTPVPFLRASWPGLGTATRSTGARCQAELELANDLRAVKSTLMRKLQSAGAISDGSRAMISALSNTNPSDPDPAADVELWSGTFDVIVSEPLACILQRAGCELCKCGASISADGALEIEIVAGCQGRPVATRLYGTLAACGETALELTFSDEQVQEAAEGAQRDGMLSDATSVLSSVYERSALLTIAYLDQDLMVGEAGAGDLHVLSRRPADISPSDEPGR